MSIKISGLGAAADANLTSAAVLPITDSTGTTVKGTLAQTGGAIDVLKTVFNVKSPKFGAVGDGSTNDTTAITAAITAASAVNGRVLFPDATYIATLTNVPSNVELKAVSCWGATIKLPAAANTHVVTVASGAVNVTLSGLVLDGNASNQSAGNYYGILPTLTDGLTLDRVKITNTKAHGMRSEGSISGGTTTNTTVRNCVFENIGGYGIILNEKHTASRFFGNRFSNWGNVTAASDAIALWSTNAAAHGGVQIANNRFVASSSNLFAIESVTPYIAGISVVDNTFDGQYCGVSIACNDGVCSNNTFLDGIGTHRSGFELFPTNTVVSGNTIKNGTIAISPSSVWGILGSNVNVTGNVVRNSTLNGDGIAIGGTIGSNRIKVIGNTIDMTGATGSFEGIMVGVYGVAPQSLTDITVQNNTLLATSTAGTAIALQALAGSSGFQVENNRATGFGVGVGLTASSGAGHDEVTIRANDWRGCTTAYSNTDTGGGTFRVFDNVHADDGMPYGVETANDAGWFDGEKSEVITLSTVGTTTDSTTNLLPQNSLILAVVARVTTSITTATDWKVGDTVQAARFISAQSAMTSGNIATGLNQWDPTVASSNLGPATSGAATKVRITTTGTPGAGAIRVTVFYKQFRAPQS